MQNYNLPIILIKIIFLLNLINHVTIYKLVREFFAAGYTVDIRFYSNNSACKRIVNYMYEYIK